MATQQFNLTEILSLVCKSNPTNSCQELNEIYETQLCQTLMVNTSLNFYSGLNSSAANTAAYTVLWLLFVLLFPLRHLAVVVALEMARLDILIFK